MVNIETNIGVKLPVPPVPVQLPIPPLVNAPPLEPLFVEPQFTPDNDMNPEIVRGQFLMPVRDLNGAVVRWQLRTIDYNKTEIDRQVFKNAFAKPAPWTVAHTIVSTP